MNAPPLRVRVCVWGGIHGCREGGGHGVSEEVTHMLVRGKQKIPTMVDVFIFFCFFPLLTQVY